MNKKLPRSKRKRKRILQQRKQRKEIQLLEKRKQAKKERDLRSLENYRKKYSNPYLYEIRERTIDLQIKKDHPELAYLIDRK